LTIGFGVHRTFMANCSSSALRWLSRLSPSTWPRKAIRLVKAGDLFVVPTIGFVQLYVLVIVRLARRELMWINVTAHPTAEWIAQQVTEAFPWNEVPRYLIRDRDGIYGSRRSVPISLSAYAFCHGEPGAMGLSKLL